MAVLGETVNDISMMNEVCNAPLDTLQLNHPNLKKITPSYSAILKGSNPIDPPPTCHISNSINNTKNKYSEPSSESHDSSVSVQSAKYESMTNKQDIDNKKMSTPLNTAWTLWHHSSQSTDWSIKGYTKVATFNTVEGFWEIYNALPTLTYDMWFLMRGETPSIDGRPAYRQVLPIWEDERNLQGGSFKFKIHNSEVDNIWLTLSLFLISESMCKKEDAIYLSGLSCSSKRNEYCTISVWNLDATRNDYSNFPTNIPGVSFSKSMFEPHIKRKTGNDRFRRNMR